MTPAGLVALVCLFSTPTVVLTGDAMGEDTYTLKGRIMDTSGNWLNDARVGLRQIGVETQSDPNGNFVLKFTITKPLRPIRRKTIEYLDVDKEGHLGRSINIDSMDFFSQTDPIEIKLEPNPVEGDAVGFSVRMSTANVVGVFLRELRAKKGYRNESTDIPPEAFAEIIRDRKVAPPGKQLSRAEFHVYVPETVKKVKAAFYISRHGMGGIGSPVLRKFAEDEEVALVGFLGDPVQRGLFPVSLLDKHIQRLAEMSKHPELPDVPIFAFGHSNGTGFSAGLASQRPEKVIAWVSFHSGYSSYLQFPNVGKVPALIMHGMLDDWFHRHGQDQTVANMRRKRDAAMAMMLEGSVGHGPVNAETTWAFIVEFCKAAMRIRLGRDGKLRPVNIESGWLGAVYDKEKGGQQLLDIAPYAEFKGDRSTANWLPDEAFARVWQQYGNTRPVRQSKPR